MRARSLMILTLLAAVAPACKHKPPPGSPGSEGVVDLGIPREFAVQQLRDILPTAEYTYCTVPKESLKPTEIKAWNVKNEMVEIDYGKAKNLTLNYAEITDVRLEPSGRYSAVSVFTSVQPEPGKHHFQFLWKQPSAAKNAGDLLFTLKKK